MPFFSIITPTLQRPSLFECVQSVLQQSFTDWEMLVQVDAENIDYEFWNRISPTRKIWVDKCGGRHNNFGNTCRHLAWKRATGEWVIYLDDDNTLYDLKVLERIAKSLEGREEKWAIFPIMRHGQRFFADPPGTCYVDTGNMVIRREVAQWPNRDEYTLDGIFCEQLKEKYPYAAFPDVDPIIRMEHSSEGK